jgi:hypothetical protein
VSRKTLEWMSASQKGDANDAISKTLKTKFNKEVNSTLLDIAHKEKPALLNCEFGTTTSARQKRGSAAASEVEAPVNSNVAWLQYGLKSRTHEKRGWLKDKLLHLNLMEGNKESLWKRILSDYKCQLAAIEDMRLTLG